MSINKALSLIQQIRTTTVFKNMGYLFITQILNCIFPLITVSYLIKTIDVTNYGKFSFGQAFVSYFIVFVDYGFNLSATRKIAECKDDKTRLAKVFADTIFAKAVLLAIALTVYIGILAFSPKMNDSSSFYLLFFGMVIGSVFYPQWFFQGIQKMGYITLINLFIKTIFLALIIFVVKDKDDYIYLPSLYSLSYLLPGAIAFMLAFRSLDNMFYLSRWADIKATLQDGFYLFISSGLSVILSGSAIFILGLMANDTLVGYFSGYDRLIKACVLVLTAITTAIFPRVSQLFAQNRADAIRFIKKTGMMTVGLSICVVLGMILFLPLINRLFLTPDFIAYRSIFYILSVWIIVAIINNFIGIQYLTGSGQARIYSMSFIIAACITLFLLYFLTERYSYIGTACAVLFGEISLSISMSLFIYMSHRRKKLNSGL